MSLRLSGLSGFYLFQRSLQVRNADMYRSSEQLSSQKRINRPSDDPEGAKTILNFKTALDQIDQYRKNVGVARRGLQSTEIAMNSVKDLLNRAKEIAIQGNNSALALDGRRALAAEIRQKAQELLGLANTEVNGEHIFSGIKTDTVPFTLDANYPATPTATFAGSNTLKSVLIGQDTTIATQVDGENLFLGDGTASSVDLFNVLGTLATTLETTIGDDTDRANYSAAMGDLIEDLDIGFNQTLREITSLGGKMNRLETTEQNFLAQTESMKQFISDIEDKDIAEITMEFQRAQIALQATLGSANAMLSLPSLMDFVGR